MVDSSQDRPSHVRSSFRDGFSAIVFVVAVLVAPSADAQAPCSPAAQVDVACQREITQLKAQLEDMLQRLTPLHPDVKALQDRIASKGSCQMNNSAVASTHCDPHAQTHSSPPPEAGTKATTPFERSVADGRAAIGINLHAQKQTFEGFGAQQNFNVLARNTMTDDQWRRTILTLVQDIGARTGAGPATIETTRPIPLGSEFPKAIDFSAVATLFKEYERFSPVGIADVYPIAHINTGAHPWLKPEKVQNYSKYLDDTAAKAVEIVADWKRRSGQEPEYLQLWNEPLSGNREFENATVGDLLAVIKQTGRRLRQHGYSRVRFVVPNEETVQQTLDDMRVIAQDREAVGYIGALAYHTYPYGSVYSYIPRLLSIRAHGNLDPQNIQERADLKALADGLGIPLWMTEVSNGFSPGGPRSTKESFVADSMDWIIGRAIHIHDEFRYAGASAYYGMFAVWTDTADKDHFPNGGAQNMRSEGDTLVLVDTVANEVMITGMGHAIAHYGRWLKRGARYVGSTSSNPFVLVSPFVDGDNVVVVLINSAGNTIRTNVRVDGRILSGRVTGEQSQAGTYHKRIQSFSVSGDGFDIVLPGWSVTSLSVPMR